ncbi:hypothetical protein VNI00_017512 [Paramarasmius palmivorus]|uniref:Uncharacterized protein n=1 Tax=Paramarasmius palmivorus TaxID=297713 RepID=A0AAW0B0R3_9AGAR
MEPSDCYDCYVVHFPQPGKDMDECYPSPATDKQVQRFAEEHEDLIKEGEIATTKNALFFGTRCTQPHIVPLGVMKQEREPPETGIQYLLADNWVSSTHLTRPVAFGLHRGSQVAQTGVAFIAYFLPNRYLHHERDRNRLWMDEMKGKGELLGPLLVVKHVDQKLVDLTYDDLDHVVRLIQDVLLYKPREGKAPVLGHWVPDK